MKKFRVSIENTFCRDVFLEAEGAEAAKAKASEEDYDEDDWCADGHEPKVGAVVEMDDDWEEIA